MTLEPFASAPRAEGIFSLPTDAATHLVRTIHDGWRVATAHPEFSGSAYEPEMTQRLRTGMRQATDSHGPALPMRILGGMEVHASANAPRPIGLTDIPIIFDSFPGHEPHVVIECKRVAGRDANLRRLYVTEGIDRFKSGKKYGVNHDTGFMVGYVVHGTVFNAVVGINGYLERHDRPDDHLTASGLIDDSSVRQSIHARAGREPVELHHVFLVVPGTRDEARGS